jgi:hypothetical protein
MNNFLSFVMTVRSRLFGIVEVDLRSLALMRICFGVLMMVDACVRLCDASALFSAEGAVPAWLSINFNNAMWSFHWLNDSVQFAQLLLWIYFSLGLLLALGYRTVPVSWMCWASAVSMHSRMPHCLNSGDTLMGLLLLFGAMTPWNARWSLDAFRDRFDELLCKQQKEEKEEKEKEKEKEKEECVDDDESESECGLREYGNRIWSAATLGLQIQIMVIYVTTVFWKSGAEYYDGTSVGLVLQYDIFVTPLAQWVRENVSAELLQAMAFYTIRWEQIGPLLIWAPWGPLRCFAVFSFYALHMGFGTMLNIGLFLYIPCVGCSVFMPAWFWERCVYAPLGWLVSARSDCASRPVAIECARGDRRTLALVALATSLWLRDGSYTLRFVDDKIDGGVSVRDAKDSASHGIGPSARRLAANSPWLWLLSPLGSLLAWPFLVVSQSSDDDNALPTPRVGAQLGGRHRRRRRRRRRRINFRSYALLEAFAWLCVIYVVMLNVGDFYSSVHPRWSWDEHFGKPMRLTQRWNMFSPSIPTADGWWVIPATLSDGSELDLFKDFPRGGELLWQKPVLVSAQYRSQRWRKYMERYREDTPGVRQQFARYVCMWWAANAPAHRQLDSFEIDFVGEETLSNLSSTPPLRYPLLRHTCNGIVPPTYPAYAESLEHYAITPDSLSEEEAAVLLEHHRRNKKATVPANAFLAKAPPSLEQQQQQQQKRRSHRMRRRSASQRRADSNRQQQQDQLEKARQIRQRQEHRERLQKQTVAPIDRTAVAGNARSHRMVVTRSDKKSKASDHSFDKNRPRRMSNPK